jgi:hypothetical protein
LNKTLSLKERKRNCLLTQLKGLKIVEETSSTLKTQKMNHSTENVTLLAQFILDVLTAIETLNLEIDADFVSNIKENTDLTDPYNQVPIASYNELCSWVEQHLGKEAIVAVGEKIGKTVYQILIENGLITESSSVEEILNGLEVAASSTIQDPEERGWEILESGTNTAAKTRAGKPICRQHKKLPNRLPQKPRL